MKGWERRKPWLTNEKMVSYTGSSTGSNHKQHSHTMQTQRIILRSRGDRKLGVGKKEVFVKQ